MSVELTATQVLAGFGGFVVLVLAWRAGGRRSRRAADAARGGARLLSLAGRVVVTAGAIVGVQWLVITHGRNTTLVWVVLGLPALFAAYTLTRALTVATHDRRDGRR
ncbi:hypothetical protein [Actinosynnema sp. NPDC020468]|uniref:hypothetical protein n=1 Tax=Actinosynnema sp. NPDC020468 TaxID=3154488 RepID=UPI0033C6CC5E